MNEKVELSDAEKELILLKRKEEELEKQKKEIEKSLERQEEITKKKRAIQKHKEQAEARCAKAKEWFKEFPDTWKMVEGKTGYCFQCYEYHYDKTGDDRKEVYFEEKVSTPTIHFELKADPSYKVFVEDDIVYSKYGYSRGQFNGFVMRLRGVDYKTSNRKYKRPLTVYQKVEEHIASKKRKEENTNSYKILAEERLEYFKRLFPEADIELKETWVSNYYSRGGEERWQITVHNKNETRFEIILYPSGSYTKKIMFPSKIDDEDLMLQLSKMEFKEGKEEE